MTTFWILWGIDAVISIVILYFFFIGLNDGSVSSFNMGLWLFILVALAAIMGGSLWLKTNHMAIAKALLWIMAIPGILYGLFMLLVIFSGAKWN